MEKANEIFKGPYTTDGSYIYDCNNQMCLMVGDCENYPEEMLDRICEILNHTKPTKGNPGKNELVSYKISVKDLKYSKLVDAYKVELKKQEEIKRKQQAQKALDF